MYYKNDLIYDLITNYQDPKIFLEGFEPNKETLRDYCAEIVLEMREEMLPKCELSDDELIEGMIEYLSQWIEETHYLKVDPHTGEIVKKEKENMIKRNLHDTICAATTSIYDISPKERRLGETDDCFIVIERKDLVKFKRWIMNRAGDWRIGMKIDLESEWQERTPNFFILLSKEEREIKPVKEFFIVDEKYILLADCLLNEGRENTELDITNKIDMEQLVSDEYDYMLQMIEDSIEEIKGTALSLNVWQYFLEWKGVGDVFLSRDHELSSKEAISIQAIRYLNRIENNDNCHLYRFRKGRIQWYHADRDENGQSAGFAGEWIELYKNKGDKIGYHGKEGFNEIKKNIESTLSIGYSVKISI